MARFLPRSLIRDSRALSGDTSVAAVHRRLLFFPSYHAARLAPVRSRSSRPEKAELVEVDLAEAEASSPAAGAAEVEVLGMRRLEDAIHSIVVRRSAPDWLPFLPGASYWVPPRRRPHGLAELVRSLANPMTEEEAMSFTSACGWPSSAYFVDGVSPHPVKKRPGKATTQSDDEEAE